MLLILFVAAVLMSGRPAQRAIDATLRIDRLPSSSSSNAIAPAAVTEALSGRGILARFLHYASLAKCIGPSSSADDLAHHSLIQRDPSSH